MSVYFDGTFRFCGQVFASDGEVARVAEIATDVPNSDNPPCFRGNKLLNITTPLNTIFHVSKITKIEVRKSAGNWNKLWPL